MDIEKYKKAGSIRYEINRVDEELNIWESKVLKPSDLGFKQKWNNDHMIGLPCNYTPKNAFDSYREACINALKVRKAELEAEFAAL